MTKDWERFERDIETLYVKQRKSLKNVQKILYERHGFQASTRAFRKKLEEWGYRKNKISSRRRRTEPSTPPYDDKEFQKEPPPQPQFFPTEQLSPRSQSDGAESASEAWSIRFGTPDRDIRGPLPHTGLLEAVNLRQLGRVLELLARGDSPAESDCLGNTPLHYASSTLEECDDDPVVFYIAKALLDHGGDPLARNKKGCTPLRYWAASGNILQYALPACSNIDVQNDEGDTPLHWTIRWTVETEQPTVDAVLTFIKAGANVDIPGQDGATAFDLVVEPSHCGWYRSPSDVALFVERSEHLNEQDLSTLVRNPGLDDLLKLHTGVSSWATLVRCLITQDPISNLLEAIGGQLVTVYLQRVIDWPTEWYTGPTQDLLKQLLAKLDIKLIGSTRNPLLHQIAWSLPLDSASTFFMSTVIEDLLERNADPNGRNTFGATPLMVLLQRGPNKTLGYFTAIQCLLAHGANPLLPCNAGLRPVYVAMQTFQKSSMRETVITSCLNAFKPQSGPPLWPASAFPDSKWWARWATESNFSWKHAFRHLKQMPHNNLPLAKEDISELQRIAATLVADRSLRDLKHLYRVDSKRPSDHYPQIAAYEKDIMRIVRAAQVYGVAINPEWVDINRSLPSHGISEIA